ncbi:pirin family protein [Lachancea thermotolerans CBS 6340]|uniref:KLTH0C11154p n=1 Tax=Lachancea thermotolerans (strain ATCC 56472 / CBS 6340 / NRRL Y-8284) TaxID=559295 RepID=C5DEQ2_LACTC|nr:KLTH0C11154p [Lachancea thermotolerans CBS 6340]CAR22263.1 KLTH0C11154p [Lachancea thermotolerans CBS 6340]
MNKPRSILKYFTALEQSEGVGAKVRRSIGSQELRNFTPFLMLDHFNVSPPAGFPDHPHHGQETITYVLGGMIAHEDFTGSRGVLRPGDLQFMTAGKGIIHSEIPVELESGAPSVGLQLWVDLPMHLKDCEPRYRDLLNNEIPSVQPKAGLEVRVISGESYGVGSMSELAYTPVHFYHYITRKPGTTFEQHFPSNFNVFMYVLKGSVIVNGKTFAQYSSVFFNTDGSRVEGSGSSEESEFILIGGEVLDQPILQYGPFVETSKQNMYEVIGNYQSGTNGFERAQGWSSSIARGVVFSDVAKIESCE